MKNINIIIRYGGEKQPISIEDNKTLNNLLQELADRGSLPQNQDWVVTKLDSNTALILDKSLAANNIVDGDILDLALPTFAG